MNGSSTEHEQTRNQKSLHDAFSYATPGGGTQRSIASQMWRCARRSCWSFFPVGTSRNWARSRLYTLDVSMPIFKADNVDPSAGGNVIPYQRRPTVRKCRPGAVQQYRRDRQSEVSSINSGQVRANQQTLLQPGRNQIEDGSVHKFRRVMRDVT